MSGNVSIRGPLATNRGLKSNYLSNNTVEKKGLVKPVAPRAAIFYKTAQRHNSNKTPNDSLDALRGLLDEQEKRLSVLEDNRKAILEKNTLSEEQLRKQERNINELKERLNRLLKRRQSIENNLESTRTQQEAVKAEEILLNQSIREATVEIECLRATLDSQKCKTEHFENEALEQRRRIEDTKNEIQVLQGSLEHEKHTRYQQEKARYLKTSTVERMQTELEQLREEVEAQRECIDKNKYENEKMSQEKKEYSQKSRDNGQQLEQVSDKVKKLLARLEFTRERTTLTYNEIEALEKDKTAFSREYEKLQKEEQMLETRLAEIVSKLDLLSQDMQRLQSREEVRLNECKHDTIYLQECLQESMKERQNLETELANSQQVSNRNREQWNDLQQEVDELQSIIFQKEKETEEEIDQKNNLLRQMERTKEILSLQQSEISELDKQCREDETKRRCLHNLVQELKGNIRVFCRIRPHLAKGIDNIFANNVTVEANRLSISSASSVSSVTSCNTITEPQYRILSNNCVEVVAPQRNSETNKSTKNSLSKWSFSFDRIFSPESTQEDVFEEISQLVQSALDGYRVCIFAYGQTGSGKTYTMLGGENEEESGVIPKSMRKIFSVAEHLQEHNWEFHLKASFLEIYNETIRDLLTDQTSSKERNYDIKVDRLTGATYVVGLTVEEISTPYQLEKLLKKSMANRATAATRCNDRSSRSHSVFRLYISGRNRVTGQERIGLLNLIDLAGSERLDASGSTGDRLKETQHINKSLSALGDVISSISNREKYIPFRNSKLTYLLQDSLGGDSKTLMFVNVSPTAESFQESLCSLRFAQKVNSCQIGTARRVTKVDLCAGFFSEQAIV